MSDPRSTRRWKALAQHIIERDGACVVCGSTEQLQVDHRLPVSQYPELAFEEENLQTMCATHNRQKSNNTTGQLTDYWNPTWLSWERKSA